MSVFQLGRETLGDGQVVGDHLLDHLARRADPVQQADALADEVVGELLSAAAIGKPRGVRLS